LEKEIKISLSAIINNMLLQNYQNADYKMKLNLQND